MFRYYLLLAWRMMKKQKMYTFINVLGLSIGISACLIIYLVVSHEFSFDRFHPDRDLIFRITGEVLRVNGDKEFVNSVVPDVAGIENDIPGFEAKTGIWHYDASVKASVEGNETSTFTGEHVVVTSPDYFKIFKYNWVAGDEASALQEPNTVVITRQRARLYFGETPIQKIIGKILTYNDSLTLKVTGVIEEWQENTDLPYSDFISLGTANNPFLKNEIASTNWSSLRPHGTMAFVKLNPNTSAEKVNKLLHDYLVKNAKAAFYGKLVKLELQSINDLHFTHAFNRADDGDGFRKAHLPTMYMLIGIALFILILAVVNFVNLSTALSLKRVREIGVRKVLGVRKNALMLQLLSETFVFTLFAVIIACTIANPVIRFFSNYLPPEIRFSFTDWRLFLFLAFLTIVTTVLAGIYPAKVLSSLVPVLSLKGLGSHTAPTNIGLRKGLIIFQFAVSMIFIIGTLVINHQLQYMRSKDKGFKTDAVITINNWGAEPEKMQLLAQEIKQVAGVNNAILQGEPPMGLAESSSLLKYRGAKTEEVEVILKSSDENFVPFYKMKLIAGRNLSDADSSREIIINETCAKAIGFSNPGDAIGKFFYGGDENALPVVGVVADFHMNSFHTPIRPMIIQHNPERETSMAVSIASANINFSDTRKIISAIELRWKKIYPQQDFNYIFLDDYIGWLFEKEEQAASLINAAMIITIFISCMGLFGLAMYTAERRTREIGIRKILGASVFGITAMLSRDFIKLIIIAALIASPIAWLVMNQWLQDFVYRVDVSWWIFFIALGIALIIAMITISFQSIKAAVVSPVKSLRTE